MSEAIFHSWHPARDREPVQLELSQAIHQSIEEKVSGLSGQKRRIALALLRAGHNGCTNVELAHPSIAGIRFGGRIHELRQSWMGEQGYEVKVTIPDARNRPGLRLYKLVRA